MNRTTNVHGDPLGTVVRVVNPTGHAAATVYDALDRVTSTTDAMNGTVVYKYDANGNLPAHVDQKGNRTGYG